MDEVNALAAELVRRCEAALPDRVSGYYLVGSYAVGEATPASDVDIVVVFRAPLDEAGQVWYVESAGRSSGGMLCPAVPSGASQCGLPQPWWRWGESNPRPES